MCLACSQSSNVLARQALEPGHYDRTDAICLLETFFFGFQMAFVAFQLDFAGFDVANAEDEAVL